MEADILPLHRGYSTENSDEDSKEWMLPTRGVEYASLSGNGRSALSPYTASHS